MISETGETGLHIEEMGRLYRIRRPTETDKEGTKGRNQSMVDA